LNARERPLHILLRLALLALMGLIVAYPLLQPAMLCGADFPGHLAHAVELDRLVRQGVLYPRWSPDFVFGYGYSTFNYYPPLPRYVAVALHGLGVPLRDAVKLTMMLGLMLAGPAMYLFVRSIYGERAGMVAGLSYTFAPYLVNNALQRFAVNEALAMAFAPLVFLAFAQLSADVPRWPWRKIALAALAYAVLMVTHSLMTAMFTSLIVAYLILLWWFCGRSLAFIGRAALAGVLALGLSAFFWLPFIAEVGWVQMWRATILDLTGELLYPLNFLRLRDLLFPPMLWPNYQTGDPLILRYLALPQIVLAIVALMMVRFSLSKLTRSVALLFGVVLVVTTFLITPAAKSIWDNVQPVQIVQFPWRFLAPASFALALLAGVGWSNFKIQISNVKTKATAYALTIGLFMVWTLPWVRPFTCAIEPNPSSAFLLWVDSNHIGGGSGGEFLPKGVELEPTESPLEADLLSGRPVDRLDRQSLPEGAEAKLISSRPLQSVWEIRSSAAFNATINNFYFPGWSVNVDGVATSISPAPSTSLIVASIPAGQHVITLRMDPTREQMIGNGVSILSVLVTLVLIVAPSQSTAEREAQHDTNDNVPAPEWAMLAIIGGITLVVRLGLASAAPPGPALPPTMTRLSTDLGSQVQLLGFEYSSPAVRAGDTLTVTLYWQAPHILITSYKSFIHVTDASGAIITQNDAVPANWSRPTTGWLPSEWIADAHAVNIPATVHGPLDVWAGMYDPATGQPLKPAGNDSGRIKLSILTP